jgi:TetR/AcrR family transcriptional regulator
MLAEAAGISKALIFHHFKSKKELYFCVLDRCIEKVKAELRFDDLPEYEDFCHRPIQPHQT